MESEGNRPDVEVEAATAIAQSDGQHFELYKLAVEMADRISARRGIANSFFLSVNTGLASFLGVIANPRWYMPVAGLAFCVTWWALLKSYRDLNRAKFEVIVAMEEQLPVRVFGDEWAFLKKTSAEADNVERKRRFSEWTEKYRELGQVERVVPVVFGAIYLTELIRQIGC